MKQGRNRAKWENNILGTRGVKQGMSRARGVQNKYETRGVRYITKRTREEGKVGNKGCEVE